MGVLRHPLAYSPSEKQAEAGFLKLWQLAEADIDQASVNAALVYVDGVSHELVSEETRPGMIVLDGGALITLFNKKSEIAEDIFIQDSTPASRMLAAFMAAQGRVRHYNDQEYIGKYAIRLAENHIAEELMIPNGSFDGLAYYMLLNVLDGSSGASLPEKLKPTQAHRNALYLINADKNALLRVIDKPERMLHLLAVHTRQAHQIKREAATLTPQHL